MQCQPSQVIKVPEIKKRAILKLNGLIGTKSQVYTEALIKRAEQDSN